MCTICSQLEIFYDQAAPTKILTAKSISLLTCEVHRGEQSVSWLFDLNLEEFITTNHEISDQEIVNLSSHAPFSS